ncbi:unnamed protein product [Rhizophagus irregularis]|nr:unnamed protein product [Rhizophagus irregularis]
MSTETQKYIGHETLVSYIIETKSNNWTYYGFLSHNRDIIIASLAQLTSSTFTLAKWQSFDVAWKNRFLDEANKLLDSNAFAELKKKVCLFLFCKVWVTPNTPRGHLVRITVLTSFMNLKTHLMLIYFINVLKMMLKNNIINHPVDLFTINLNLENNQYTSLEDFEKDVRLIFCNCYTYNDVGSEIYSSELKRTRDNDVDDTDGFWKKQRQILEQNMDNLMSKMSLSSANESMLQAIVEILLPLKYRIPELSLVMDGKKPKG